MGLTLKDQLAIQASGPIQNTLLGQGLTSGSTNKTLLKIGVGGGIYMESDDDDGEDPLGARNFLKTRSVKSFRRG